MARDLQLRDLEHQHQRRWNDHDYPIAQPMMVCPCCETYWCVVQQMEWELDIVPATVWGIPKYTYYLLASCPCGAQWAAMV